MIDSILFMIPVWAIIFAKLFLGLIHQNKFI